jgi:hypothetical protein
MPFASSRQERFMFAEHPDIAKRWSSEFGSFKSTGQAFKPSPRSESHEVWAKGVDHKPRLPGVKRDFKGLTPSEIDRHHPKAASESEAMSEGQGTTFQHGSRHHELGEPEKLQGLRRRDVLSASRQLPHVKNP